MTISNDSPNKEMTMKKKTFTGADISKPMIQNATLGAIFQIIFGLFSSVGGFLKGDIVSWQDYVLLVTPIIVFIFGLTSLVLLRRGKPLQGSSLVFINNLMLPIVAILLQTGLGWAVFVYALTSSMMLIWQVMPKVTRSWTVILTGLALALIVAIEWFNPSVRVAAGDELSTFFYGATAILVAIFLVQAVRETWGQSMRNKLLIAFIAVAVIATSLLGTYSFITTTNSLQENLERELTSQTISKATRIGDLFNEQINIITALSLNQVLQQAVTAQNNSYEGSLSEIQAVLDAADAEWQAADEANQDSHPLVKKYTTNNVAGELLEFRKSFPDNVEVFVTDVHGGLAGSTNRTSDYYQADEEWWQTTYNNGQGGVFISDPVFDESAGAMSVQIALPLRSQDLGQIVGIVRTTYIISPLSNILSESIGETDEADLIVPGDVVSRVDYTGELEPIEAAEYEELQAIAAEGMVVMEYEGVVSVITQATVQTLEGNPAVDNLGWVVVSHQHEDEAFAPINAQIRGMVIVATIILLLAVAAAVILSLYLVKPITQLTQTAGEIAAGNLDSRAQAISSDEIGTLASTFNSMTSRLQETLQGLEQRVAERTRNLELAAEVGRAVSQVRALEVMLKDAAELIRSQFDLYYVQVYLTDPSQTNLLLLSGTGQVGEQLVGRNHRLPLNASSINGRAAIEKKSVIIADTTASATFRPNPLLPDTRSEMAIPLIVGNKVVGVLDLQSEKANALTREILPAFEALAGQVAIAIQNANLLAETEQARAEVEAQARRLVRANWTDYQDAIHRPEETGFVFEQNKISVMTQQDKANKENSLVAPISVTGETLGNLVVEMSEQSQGIRTAELVNKIAAQVAQHIESLRLLESAERYRAEAEEASRRLSREGWNTYKANTDESLSYFYDLKEVRPFVGNGHDESALSVPLKVHDEILGKLSIQGLDANDSQALELANAVAERLSAHIEGLRQFDETRRGQIELDKRAQQLSAVAEISSVSSRELDIQKMLASVVSLTQRKFGLYHAHVFTYNETTAELKISACGWKEGDEHEGTHGTTVIPIAQEQSLVARAARTKQPVIVNDVRNEPGWLPNPLLPDTASELAVPLLIGDQILGVLDVQSNRINAFTEEDANIQTTLASQVATALQNARSFARAQQQANRESTLNVISQKIQSATSVEAVLQIAARELGHALGAPMTVAQLSMKDKS